jgi:hypothetical protein
LLSYISVPFSFKAFRCITLHNEQPHGLYKSPNLIRVIKSRIMRLAVHVARMAEGIGFLVGKSEAKRPLGRLSHRLGDNIKIDLQER